MQEIALLLLVMAAVSSGGSHTEEGCRATGRDTGEVAVCGDTRELDAQTLGDRAPRATPARRPALPASLPSDELATGSKPLGPADLDNVPKGRRY
jgi:hypothetical protein